MSDLSIRRCLELALDHFKAGRADEADLLCRRVLREHPGQTDALHLLGMLARRAERREAAVALVAKASELHPGSLAYMIDLGCLLAEVGQKAEAAEMFQQVLAHQPDNQLVRRLLEGMQPDPPSPGRPPTRPEMVARLQATAERLNWPISPTDIFAVASMDIADFTAANCMQARHWPIEDDDRIPPPDWPRFPAEWQPFWPIMEERARRGLIIAENAEFLARQSSDCHFDVFTRNAILVERDFQIPAPTHPDNGIQGLMINLTGLREAVIGLRRDVPVRVIDEPAIFINGHSVYGHYLLDIAPKLVFCALDPGLAKLPIYCPPILGYQREVIEMLGLSHLDLREVDVPQGTVLQFRRGFLPGHIPYPYAVHWLRRRHAALHGATGRRDRRFFLSRASMVPERRRLANEEEVASFLSKRGFTTIYPEQMPVAEVAKLISEAEIIVSPVGSTTNNSVFAPPGTRLIELVNRELFQPEHRYWITNYPLLAYFQIEYRRVLGTPQAGVSGRTINLPITIPIAELEAALSDSGK